MENPHRLIDFFFVAEASETDIAALLKGGAEGALTPVITDRYPLEDVTPGRELPLVSLPSALLGVLHSLKL